MTTVFRRVAAIALAVLASIGGTAFAAGAAPTSRYIITLKDPTRAEASRTIPANADRSAEVRAIAHALVKAHGGSIDFVYGSALFGFAATMSPAQAAAMTADPRVAAMETDAVIRIPPRPGR